MRLVAVLLCAWLAGCAGVSDSRVADWTAEVARMENAERAAVIDPDPITLAELVGWRQALAVRQRELASEHMAAAAKRGAALSMLGEVLLGLSDLIDAVLSLPPY